MRRLTSRFASGIRNRCRGPKPLNTRERWATVPVLPMLVLVAGTIACTQGGAQSKVADDKPATPVSETGTAAKGKEASSTKVAQGAKKKPAIFTSFPTVDVSGLGEAEMLIFQQITNEEICPCSCPKSFAACLQAGTKCEPAVILANWLASELRQGVPGEILADQITKEIAGGYGAKPKRLNTTGFASKGASNAAYTIVEFADFECGHCKAAAPVVADVVKRHPKDVRVFYKHFPLSFHEMAKPAAIAAEAAQNQGKFWPMHDAIFATQTMLDEDLLMGHARALGLDIERFSKDFKSAELAAKVDASKAEGETMGVEATPTFFINGRPFNLMRTKEAFEARLNMEKARKSARCE